MTTERKVISFPTFVDRQFSIDAIDYRALETILRGCGYRHHFWEKIRAMITQDEESKRVLALRLSGVRTLYLSPSIGQLSALQELDLRYANTEQLRELPIEVGYLCNLTKLDLQDSGVASLPSSIGRLRNLKELNLNSTIHLRTLPEEIGDLSSLVRLSLHYSRIMSLPPSIGRLKNLQKLVLASTSRLRSLPDEIGNLSNLVFLTLGYSGIMSLPASIGQLQNLQKLYLHCTEHLRILPEEIGGLGNLKTLVLAFSAIRSLPPSIGQLSALQYLEISSTEQLTNLPDDIGNLSSLNKLVMCDSGVSSLPGSIHKLDSLRFLTLTGNRIRDLNGSQQVRDEFVSSLVQGCKSLGWIDVELANGKEYALACNRFRSRTTIAAIGTNFFGSKGCSIILENATHAFRAYDDNSQEGVCDFNRIYTPRGLEPQDAIYRFLVDYRKSFVEVLINRTRKSA